MRIISGTLRGKSLAVIHGKDIRPTSDKIRGAIFSALQSRMGSFEGLIVLDLFAGSGALSIEALSRGADFAVLVDSSSASRQLASKNLAACSLTPKTQVVAGNALSTVQKVLPKAPFDLVFIDPPYGKSLAVKALEKLSSSELLSKGARVVVETGKGEPLSTQYGSLELEQSRIYGNTQIHYYVFEPGGGI